MIFDEKDLRQINEKGIPISTIENQIRNFVSGFPWSPLDRPATPGDGIFSFTADEISYFSQYYESHLAGEHPVKFVPASGAASRMFKHLFESLDQIRSGNKDGLLLSDDADFNSTGYLLSHLSDIAFFQALNSKLLDIHGKDASTLIAEKDHQPVIEAILTPEGLNYANLPKGLILFHLYPEGARTAVAEHLVEAARYATDEHHIARIHFTISPEHRKKFSDLLHTIKERFENLLGVKFEITFSEQKPSTDTIAVDEENIPFRNPDGSLHFRPGGHGALISNLNDIDGGIIFIKNIDNIVPDRLKPDTILYKKVLGGYLLRMKTIIHDCLAKAEHGNASAREVEEIVEFLKTGLCIPPPDGLYLRPLREQQAILSDILDRPMRVCGMVKNEGEPGGGPFWVKRKDGRSSLQIIESSQVDPTDPQQKSVLSAATHFNPVDLVCCINDYHGRKFDLDRFVDPATGFISTKSSSGKTLKAQELPGLWNGAMARWITVFVEVPVITFNPVKTVNDLLRPQHIQGTINNVQ